MVAEGDGRFIGARHGFWVFGIFFFLGLMNVEGKREKERNTNSG